MFDLLAVVNEQLVWMLRMANETRELANGWIFDCMRVFECVRIRILKRARVEFVCIRILKCAHVQMCAYSNIEMCVCLNVCIIEY